MLLEKEILFCFYNYHIIDHLVNYVYWYCFSNFALQKGTSLSSCMSELIQQLAYSHESCHIGCQKQIDCFFQVHYPTILFLFLPSFSLMIGLKLTEWVQFLGQRSQDFSRVSVFMQSCLTDTGLARESKCAIYLF